MQAGEKPHSHIPRKLVKTVLALQGGSLPRRLRERREGERLRRIEGRRRRKRVSRRRRSKVWWWRGGRRGEIGEGNKRNGGRIVGRKVSSTTKPSPDLVHDFVAVHLVLLCLCCLKDQKKNSKMICGLG